MTTYILRRMMLMFPTLIGVTAVVFFVMALAPGGFGGTVLKDGAQTEGDEARRMRQYFNQRYGLDKSPPVQYLRWINQVSPIGFLTASKLTFTDEAIAEARTALEASGRFATPAALTRAVGTARSLAAYEATSPMIAAGWMLESLDHPENPFPLFERFDDVRPTLLQPIVDMAGQDVTRAGEMLLRQLDDELAWRDPIHLTRPALKWPDLGTSLRGRPVTGLLAQAVPITLLLNVITIPIVYLVAILVGVRAARHRGRFFDIVSGLSMIALWSIPVIWVGVMLIGFLANKQYIRLFPTGGLHDLQADMMPFLPAWTSDGFQRGWLLDMVWHLLLPIFCLVYGSFAVLAKLMRGSLLEVISADYVRTARAKGLPENTVLYRHVFRNSLLPLITVASSILPALFAGSVIIENIFSIQGMGLLGVEAAFMKDREVVMGTTLIGGVIVLISELIRDLCYAIADPRVAYD